MAVATREKLVIPRLDFEEIVVEIKGVAPGIIADSPLSAVIVGAGGIKPVNEKDPMRQAERARYKLETPRNGTTDGFPSAGIKAAMIAACGYGEGFVKTKTKGAFFMGATEDGLLPILDAEFQPRVDLVGNAAKSKSPKGRAFYPAPWRMMVPLRVFTTKAFSTQSAVHLLALAGECVGIGCWRPVGGMGIGGWFGRFDLVAIHTPEEAANV